MILAELKSKIQLLKQAYFNQMDQKKSWEQVDEILRVLKTGCKYLDFPEDDDIRKYLLDDRAGMEYAEQATSPLSATKIFLGAGSRLKPPGLRIEAVEGSGIGQKTDEEQPGIAATILENIAEENGIEDGDTSLDKNPKTENDGTNEMDAEGEFHIEQAIELQHDSR